MIYTVTFNPSLDYTMRMDEVLLGMVNRTQNERFLPGGKGINVSVVLHNMGIKSIMLGFLAGFTGREIEERLRKAGCDMDFIHMTEGFSRINVKLKAAEETDINGQGPAIGAGHLDCLYKKLDCLCEDDILVLAGSIPDTVPKDIYERIMERLQNKKLRIIVDAAGDLLKRVLPYRPFLVKPNHHELGELFGVTLSNRADAARYAGRLREMGARNVLVSMAGDGAVFTGEDGSRYESDAPKGRVVNSVGAGDSMVAGFLAGYLRTSEYKDAFYMGMAAGSASAFSENLASEEEVMALYNRLKD